MRVLTINAGSSSVRLAILEASPRGLHRAAASHGSQPPERAEATLHAFMAEPGARPVDVVAHRVVHGGARLVDACTIDGAVEAEIHRLGPLAPLHNPVSLQWIRASRAVLGQAVPQVAVFDTAFYAALPEVARHYALPHELSRSLGLRRFGFHGIAHQAMVRRWRQLQPSTSADARIISLQLGAGCSITATRGSEPVDTSMGFTPLEGLVMATRSGDVDPGLLLYLQRTLPMPADSLEHLLNTSSGLLGMTGSNDMRQLLESRSPEARLAIELYCYRARKYVGAYLAVLGGADAVLFGGGVGENAPEIRARILDGLQWAGIHLDGVANSRASGIEARLDIPPAVTAVGTAAIWTLPVDESLQLAEEALRICAPDHRRTAHD